MRPGQNKRMRSRNRRGPNPLTRSYESNGPEIKIRGTAQHIAEKYTQLARDAHVAGDPVAAEGYLQHAEHYYRLIAAAQQAQFAAQNGLPDDRDDEEDEFDLGNDRFATRTVTPQAPGYGDTPEGGQPSAGESEEGAFQPSETRSPDNRPPRPFDNRRQPNREGGRGFSRFDRPERQERPERQDRPERQERPDRPERPERQERPDRFNRRPHRPQTDLEGAEQPYLPAFVTAPRLPIAIDRAPETTPATSIAIATRPQVGSVLASPRAIAPLEAETSAETGSQATGAETGGMENAGPFRARRRRKPRLDTAEGSENLIPEEG